MANAVEILIRARDGATTTLKEVQEGIKTVGDEARAGVRPMREYRDELREQARQLEATARTQDKNSEEYRRTVEELARVRRELSATTSEIDTHDAAWVRVGGTMQRFGAGLAIGVTAPLTALAATSVSLAMDLETFAASLDVLIGDAERANVVFDELYQFSARAPFDWDSLTEGTRTLAAFQVEAETIVSTLARLGDVAAGVQTPVQDLAQIYGRVHVTGRLAMEEVNRLADRGIPVYTELANILGVSESQVRDLVSAGKIGFPELEQMFVNLTEEGGQFAGMMEAVAETTEGRVNTLIDSFGQVQDIVGQFILPMFSDLVAHAQGATDWFVNLDASTQGLFVSLGIVLAASGPVLVGLGTIVRLAPQILAFFRALRVALIPLGGPMGLFMVLAGGVAALALSFSGSRSSLDESIRAASEAIASGEQDSIVTALDAVIAKVDGPVKTVFQELRDELIETGDTGVEQIGRLSRAAEMAQDLIAAQRAVTEAQERVAAASAEENAFRATGVMTDAQGGVIFDSERQWELLAQQLGNALESAVIPLIRLNADNQFEFVDRAAAEATALNLDLVERLMRSASEPIHEVAQAVRENAISGEARAELAEANENLAAILRYINEGDPARAGGRGDPAPDPPPAGGPRPPRSERTPEDVFEDFERTTREALRVATFEGTTDALVDAARRQVAAANSAIAELLSDRYEGLLPAGLLDELRQRRDAAQEIIDQGGLGPIYAAHADYLDADVARFGSGRLTPTRPAGTAAAEAAAAREAAQAEEDLRWQSHVRQLEGHALLSSLAHQAIEHLANFATGVQQFGRDLGEAYDTFIDATYGDTDAELNRFITNGERLAATLNDAADAAARAELFAAAQERWGTGRSGLAGTTAEERLPGNLDAAAAIMRDTIAAMVAGWHEGSVEVDEIRRAVEQLTTITPMTVKEINELTGGVFQLAREAERAQQVQAFDENPGLNFNTDVPPVPASPVRLDGSAPAAVIAPDLSHLPDEQRNQILAEELAARQALVDQLVTMSTENGPLGNLGAQLVSVAAQQVPAFGAALDGFVQAGPVGAVISFFTDLATNSEALRQAFAAINDALAPLGELIGTILAPALQLLGTVIGWVVDALVAIWNFLFGWIPGMRVERQPDDDPPPRTYDHSSTAPTQEMRFGNVSPAVQLAVATPLLEAATLQATAAATLQTAADSLATVYARVESFYTRLLDEGIRVTVDTPTQPAAAANTAYLR